MSYHELLAAGGPMSEVRKAAAKVTREEATEWTAAIVQGLAECGEDTDPVILYTMRAWLTQMRRIAGIKPTQEDVREQTRARVRRHRARRRREAAITDDVTV